MIMSGASGSIFDEFINTKSLFLNKEVLRHSYTPDYLPHRDEQIKSLAAILSAALRGETPSNVLIYGKTGTGKTAVARYVGKELENVGRNRNVPCHVIYLNCEIIDTQYRVLANLSKYFNRDVPMTGWPTDQVYHEFKNAIDQNKAVIIIILDEIDKLVRKGDEVLYNLSRINSELENARVSLIGISNDLKFTDYLDPRVRSSLGEEEIVFPPYDAHQLRDILEERAKLGFREGVLDDGVIPLCAAFAAQEHGDARKALDLLRIAGELAEREGAEKVTEKHVRMAQEKLEMDRIVEVIKTLPMHSKMLLFSVVCFESQGISNATSGEVYRVYREVCRELGVEPLTPRRITDLISELDMLGIISAKIVNKGRYGRTKEIHLTVPLESTKSVLLSDYRLSQLGDFSSARKKFTFQLHLQ
ncbi:MAG: ORC1-type DNA replication protein [Archaeoglobi archaeon]|nr:ORC1-type DNA replication protein [Candidatus Mnemosynella bozhongmuii]